MLDEALFPPKGAYAKGDGDEAPFPFCMQMEGPAVDFDMVSAIIKRGFMRS